MTSDGRMTIYTRTDGVTVLTAVLSDGRTYRVAGEGRVAVVAEQMIFVLAWDAAALVEIA